MAALKAEEGGSRILDVGMETLQEGRHGDTGLCRIYLADEDRNALNSLLPCGQETKNNCEGWVIVSWQILRFA